ncbi:MAG: ABC transporter substrate-binding protein [Chloroflexi bacterium]|nr:ABC transporter substrate-binding protein [Chloroflexota bacterium]
MKHITVLALMVLAVIVMACAPAPTPVPTAAPPTAAPKATEAPKATTAPTAAPVSTEPYKIGLLISLSGPAAAPAGEIRDGVMLEVDRINAAGGVNGHPLQVLVEDDGTDVTKGVTGLTKLVKQDNVLAVMGPLYSDLNAPMDQMAEKEKVPVVHTNPNLAEAVNTKYKNNTFVFSTVQPPPLLAAATLEAVKLKGYKKIIVMADNVPPMPAVMEAMIKTAPAAGIQMVSLSDTWGNADMDLTPQATKAKDAAAKEKPDALVLLTNGVSGVAFMKGMQQIGFKIPIIGAPPFGIAPTLMMGGDMVNGIVFPASKVLDPQALPDTDPQKAVALEIAKRFEAKYKYPIGQLSASGVDAINVIASALKTSGADRVKLRDALEKTTNFVGLGGVFNYKPDDHDGTTVQSQAIYEIKGGQFKLISLVK